MANGVEIGKETRLSKAIAFGQVILLIVAGVVYTDLREVRDSTIKQGTKQERLIQDVQNVEYNVRTLNNTVQRLVGHDNNKHGG